MFLLQYEGLRLIMNLITIPIFIGLTAWETWEIKREAQRAARPSEPFRSYPSQSTASQADNQKATSCWEVAFTHVQRVQEEQRNRPSAHQSEGRTSQ